jgi:hypothetical protein
MASKLKDALNKINEAVSDLTSLHVMTFTGDITALDTSKGYDGIEAQLKKAEVKSKITLVAESLYKFDGDSYNFLTESDVPAAALALHEAAVASGLETRQGLMEMFRDIFD